MDVSKMSPFEWTQKRCQAVLMLSEGQSSEEVAQAVGVSERTIWRWRADTEFSQELDRLTLMVGIASRAERLRIAKKMVRIQLARQKPTQKDLLEWLKYAQGETDGIKLDLTPLYDAIAPMAGGGQSRADEEDSPAPNVETGQKPVQ